MIDGSRPEVFAQHAALFSAISLHIEVDRRFGYMNDKVNAVHTGVAMTREEKIILADDDIRYVPETIAEIVSLLERNEVVRPQNFLRPLPWWAKMEAARMLINRATLRAGDYPGTCAFRRSTLLHVGHYDGDVLFDNEEIIRHFAEKGATIDYAIDLFVQKRPPRFRKWLEQRPRQAYEDFSLRAKTIFFFALAPFLILLGINWGAYGIGIVLGVIAILSSAVAFRGRARGNAAMFIPLRCCFFAPFWILERTLSTYWALYWYLARGGYPFGDRILARGTGRAWTNGARVASQQLRHQHRCQNSADLVRILGDIPSEIFRGQLHEIADWIADYRENIAKLPIAPTAKPGDATRALMSSAPETGVPFHRIWHDVQQHILPGMVHWGHPQFMGYFGSTTTGPGILAEMIVAALNVNAMTWRTSPAATELETLVLQWLREWLGLPSVFEGVVFDTASISTLHALAAARERAADSIRERGLAGRNLAVFRIYTSDQAHSSVEKAAIALGLGEENVRRVPSDKLFRMDVATLRDMIAEDVRHLVKPLAVVATVGSTSSASVDPVREIAAVCREHDMWLHIDAAYGGGPRCSRKQIGSRTVGLSPTR